MRLKIILSATRSELLFGIEERLKLTSLKQLRSLKVTTFEKKI